MINESKIQQYFVLRSNGMSQRQACNMIGLARSTVQGYLKNMQDTSQVASNRPVIKTIDIETSPTIAAVFGRYDQNVGQDNVVSEGGRILTACVKTLGDANVRRYFIKDWEERWNGDDFDVVEALCDEIQSADIIVGHKVKKFDLATLKARMVYHGLPALSKVQIVDTLNMARQMRFNANSLDALCSYLGIGRKQKHQGISLWIKVMQGDPDALEEMLEYNEQDVRINELAYLKMRAHANVHPNVSLYHDDLEVRCTVCGSDAVEPTGRVVNTGVSSFEEYTCTDCGHKMRARINMLSKDKRKALLVNTP